MAVDMQHAGHMNSHYNATQVGRPEIGALPCLAALLSAGAGPEGVLISGSELLRPTDPGDCRCRGGVDLAPAWPSCDAWGGVPLVCTYSCCCRFRLEGAAAVVAGMLPAADKPSSSSAVPAETHATQHSPES